MSEPFPHTSNCGRRSVVRVLADFWLSDLQTNAGRVFFFRTNTDSGSPILTQGFLGTQIAARKKCSNLGQLYNSIKTIYSRNVEIQTFHQQVRSKRMHIRKINLLI